MKNLKLRLSYFLRVLKTLSSRPQQTPADIQWARNVWLDIWFRQS